MTIECTEFRAHEKGTLQGFANFWVPKMGLEIYGCALHMKDGRRWLNLPSREYKDDLGEIKYMNIIRFRDKYHYVKFGEAAKKAIDEWCAKNASSPMVKDDPNEECPF